ncbi:hypothetical protein TERTU_1801 [Teredinibacter turnerae T7901]|uniref:Uncharacterized protein n=2 Tax=Teredinibacter turnerae TaxID=2426 RepID=C5BHS4_TERTT|nr:hypothetical protein TERTU_1801 [Teredinibacter turnerae T7901]
MKGMMGHVEVGRDYIYLDGYFIPADEGPFEVEGWHSEHDFNEPPQITAQHSPEIIERVLSNPEYWNERKI